MYGINNDISIDALYKNIINKPLQYLQDKDMDTNIGTYNF